MSDAPTRQEINALTKMAAGMSEMIEAHDRVIGQDGEQLREIVKTAFAEAIQETVTDPEFWQNVRAAMVQQTTQAAGGWLVSGIMTGLKTLLWAGIAGLALYMVGGWKLIVAVATSLGVHHSGTNQP